MGGEAVSLSEFANQTSKSIIEIHNYYDYLQRRDSDAKATLTSSSLLQGSPVCITVVAIILNALNGAAEGERTPSAGQFARSFPVIRNKSSGGSDADC